MSTVLTAFTLRGVALALRLRDLLGEGQVWTKEKFKENGDMGRGAPNKDFGGIRESVQDEVSN